MFVVNPALWCLDHPPLGDLPPTPPSSHGSVTQQLGDQLSLTRIFKWEENGKNPQHLQQSAHLQHEHVGLCSLMLLRKWNWVIWILGKWWKDLSPLLTSLPRGFTSTDLSGSAWGPFHAPTCSQGLFWTAMRWVFWLSGPARPAHVQKQLFRCSGIFAVRNVLM